MIAILKAFRDALVADATLLTLVPAANIYAGLRDEKTPIPAIDVFMIAGGATEQYAGSAIGGMTKAEQVMQLSVFHRTDAGALAIADKVLGIVLGDNTTLNTAKIKNISLMTMPGSIREAKATHVPIVTHVPIRIRFNYHFTTS